MPAGVLGALLLRPELDGGSSRDGGATTGSRGGGGAATGSCRTNESMSGVDLVVDGI